MGGPPPWTGFARACRDWPPTARLVAHGDALDLHAEFVGVTPRGHFELVLGLALEKIQGAARDMRRIAGDADQPIAAVIGFPPHCAAHMATMHDTVRHVAQ